jgi:hypothetical protein
MANEDTTQQGMAMQMLLNFRGDLTYHTFDIPNPVNFNRLALSCVEIT